MNSKDKNELKKIVFIIIFITIITICWNSVLKADTLEETKLDINSYSENYSNNLHIDAINKSNEVIKQQNDNPYEDKPYSEDYLKYLNSSDEEKAEYGGVIPEKEFIAIHNESTNKSEQLNVDINSIEATESSLPQYYKIPNLKVENQKDSGWCGIFASLKSLETYLQKNKGVDYNLAEYHLAYMSMTDFGGWKNYKEYMEEHNYSSLGETKWHHGNNFEDFMIYCGMCYPGYLGYLIKGPILGEDSENHAYDINDTTITNFQNKKPTVKVKKTISFSNISKEYSGSQVIYKNESRILTNSEIQDFRKSVKEQIKDNGGVYACVNIDKDYYNSNTKALYINSNDIILNHAVTIVGWDDNYSKNNFLTGKQPKNNGAWIALNSWGESFGDNGFLYISYDDAIVEKYMNGVVDAELANKKPTINIKYTKTYYDNAIIVTITSSDKINKPKVWKDGKWQDSTGWQTLYIENEKDTYYTLYSKTTGYQKNTMKIQLNIYNYKMN